MSSCETLEKYNLQYSYSCTWIFQFKVAICQNFSQKYSKNLTAINRKWMKQFCIPGHLLISACPVTSHPHPINSTHLFSQLLLIQSTQYIYPGFTDQTLFARLLFVTHARFSCCRPCWPLTNPSRLVPGKHTKLLSPALWFFAASCGCLV